MAATEAVDRLTIRGGSASYLDLFSSPGELMAIQVVGLAVLVLFTLGLWSRLTSILALVVILSDVHRGPMLTSQFEPVLTMVMCYLCLGPSGASWSLDRVLARRRATTALARAAVESCSPSWAATISIRLMQVHLALLMATMGGAKLFGATWWVGSAVWWLATRPESRLVDVTGLGEYSINFWTHAIVAIELGFPILIWFPLLRPLVLALAALVWISLALLTGQITFALVMLVASLSYCSPGWLAAAAASQISRRYRWPEGVTRSTLPPAAARCNQLRRRAQYALLHASPVEPRLSPSPLPQGRPA